MRGYIAMLATRAEHRGKGIATKLVRMAVDKMIEKDADEVRLALPSLSYRVLIDSGGPGDRSRQHPVTSYLRKSRIPAHETVAQVLPQREYSLQTSALP